MINELKKQNNSNFVESEDNLTMNSFDDFVLNEEGWVESEGFDFADMLSVKSKEHGFDNNMLVSFNN